MQATERLWRTKSGQLVRDGDVAAESLVYVPGDDIAARDESLVPGDDQVQPADEPKPAVKAARRPADKQAEKPADK